MARKRAGFDPLAKLQARNNVTTRALQRDLKRSLDHIQATIAGAKNPAFAATQARLYSEIRREYNALGRSVDRHLKGDIYNAAADAAQKAQDDIPTHRLVRFDAARLRRYYRYVSPDNGASLAAVFTDQMATGTINALRQSVIETERAAAIDGLTMHQKQRALQDRWGALARDNDNFRFVDKSGKKWENARYLQMLTRTTAQRVYNDAYVDRLAESGLKLVKIGSMGAPDCPVCKAWQGVICTIAGKSPKYPTLAEAKAAGVFHPNCLCTQEPIDEDLDAEEMAIQAEAGKVNFDNPEAMQRRTDKIAVDRFQAAGLTHEEAEDAMTRAKVEEAIRTGVFSTDSQNLANGLDHEQLVDFRENGVPAFRVAKKGDQVGFDKTARVVTVDRNRVEADIAREIHAAPKRTNPEARKMEAAARDEGAPAPVFTPDFTAREKARAHAAAAAQKAEAAHRRAASSYSAIQAAASIVADYAAAFTAVDFGTIPADAAATLDNAKATLQACRNAANRAAAAPDKINAAAAPTDEAGQERYNAAVFDFARQADIAAAEAAAAVAPLQGYEAAALKAAAAVRGRAATWANGIMRAVEKATATAARAFSDMQAATSAGNTEINKLLRAAGVKK